MCTPDDVGYEGVTGLIGDLSMPINEGKPLAATDDKQFLCPICGVVALTLSAAAAPFASRAISELVCQNGHRLRISAEGKVVVRR